MDPRHTGATLKHLEKQNELLTDTHQSMTQELHKLQVEEEMLMRKFYEIMNAHKLPKEIEDSNVDGDSVDGRVSDPTHSVNATTTSDELH